MAAQDPKFILLPHLFELKGRILIMKTDAPRFIFEINNPDATGLKMTESLDGRQYSVSVFMHESTAETLTMNDLKNVIRWYHQSLVNNKKPWRFM